MILLGIHPSIFTLILYLVLCASALHFNKNEESKRGVTFLLALLIVDIFLNLFFRGFSLGERIFLLFQALTVGGSLYVVVKSRYEEYDLKLEEKLENEDEPLVFEKIFLPSNIKDKVQKIIETPNISLLIKGEYGSGRTTLSRYIACKRGEPYLLNPKKPTDKLVIIEEIKEELLDKFPKKIGITTDKNYEAFSDVLEIPQLGAEDRVDLIKFLLKDFTFANDINWKVIAELTEGRALKELITLAHDTAMFKDNEIITTKTLSLALEKLLRYPA